jgi:stage II sporulation protein E
MLVAELLSVLIPIIAFLLTPQTLLQQAANALVFYRERHLSRLAINRNRAAIAERLFEVSGLFKQIQNTFLSLGNVDGEAEAKAHMQGRVLNGICKRCSGYGTCLTEGLLPCLQKMIDVGCIKGKVSLIDVPHALAGVCGRQSDLLYALNQQLGEYRDYMQDAEAAACGKQLLANQALGVSEIAKNLALEQSEPMTLYTKRERALEDALLKVGIICTEILIYGGEEATVSLVAVGEANVKKLSAAVSRLFAKPFCVVEKLTLARDKFCYILRKKPPLDAIFGVATHTKQGELFSGDTHSVLRIDERRFLVCLSDGMGSGEYARQISENTINLLESFYRTNMPPELTLSTVNRLLSFAKEETFACVDIAVVDLAFGRADVIKIGSPTGFILSDTALQILESDSLPLGILERVHPTAASYPFRAEDTLVFLSDGITEAFSSTVELYETVQALPRSNPQDFADRLLSAAMERYDGVAKDDMTVLAVRLFSSQ